MHFLFVLSFFMSAVCLADGPDLNKLPPGFSCAAALATVKTKLPLREDEKKSTARTLNELNSYLIYTLANSRATPTHEDFLIHSPLHELNDFEFAKISGQIAAITKDNDPAGVQLKAGISMRGRDKINSFFAEFEKSLVAYHEIESQNELFALGKQIQRDMVNTGKILLLIPAGMTITALAAAFHGMPLFLAVIPVIFPKTWFVAHTAFTPLRLNNQKTVEFLSEAKDFLEESSPEKRLLYFSHTYAVIPQLFEEAWNKEVLTSPTLGEESFAIHRRPVPEPESLKNMLQGKWAKPGPEVTYVTVDYLLDSQSASPEEMSLNVLIRATESKPKPKKPNLPAREKNRIWQLHPPVSAPSTRSI